MRNERRYLHLLFLFGAILWAAGYWGPWVPHKDAGLIILGIDLGEFVKFLPQVRSGQIHLWREGFYFPAFALSLLASSMAWRKELPWRTPFRILANLLSVPPALAMLPPIWTPHLMLHSPEFRQQSVAIAMALLASVSSPLLARLPRRATAAFLSALMAVSALVPLWQFSKILDAIASVYAERIGLGWGIVSMSAGGLSIIAAIVGLLLLPIDESNDPAP